jgi:molecular chaperone GrpE (heat shock protein)
MAAIEELVGARARDEQGRFVSATPAEPVKADAPTEPVQPRAETPEPVVPVTEPPKVEAQPVVPAAPAAPTQPVESPETAAYKKAMREEREKRQALQAELEALKKPKVEVDPWTDLPGALAQQQKAFQDQLQQQRLMISEDLARDKYADFEEVIQHFNHAVEANPALANQMVASRNPAEFAYKQGLLHKELGAVNGDPIAYRTKLEKDVEARVRAEFEAKYKAAPSVPTSLNSDASPPPVEAPYQGPKPLSQILRNASRS